MWQKIILITITIFFILVLVIKRFAYFQPSHTFEQPKYPFQDIQEGNLHAWYLSGKSNKVILFCHGNAGNLTSRQEKLHQLNELGHSVLIFDYSGYGHSKGIPNEQLCYANASVFVEYLMRNGVSKDDIIAYGESLGAPVATNVAKRYNLPILILESGLPSIKDLIKHWYRFFGVLGIVFNEFNTDEVLKSYKGRTLVLHSLHDEIIPYDTTKTMRELAEKHIVIEGTHNYPVIPWDEIGKFIG